MGWSPLMPPLTDADRKWFADLHASVYEEKTGYDRFRGNYIYLSPRRRLTAEEWEHLKTIATVHDLPLQLHNANMGFGIGMVVYGEAPYPGTKPEPLFWMTGEELPDYDRDRDRCGFELGWQAFSPLAQTPRNAELLAHYGMERIREKSYYDY